LPGVRVLTKEQLAEPEGETLLADSRCPVDQQGGRDLAATNRP
jgi:hypothetical protein